jgi:hypothetical protein
MTSAPQSTVQRGSAAERGVRPVVHSGAFEALSRGGFVARGLIYGIIGLFALKLALGIGGKVTDQKGALGTIAHQPLGSVLLGLVAVGLAGYSLWRLSHAALGYGSEKSDSSFERVAALGSSVVYGALCAIAVQFLLGSQSSSSSPHKAAAGVLGWPAGPWLVGLAGAVMLGVAAFQGYRGVTHDFLKDSKTEQMSDVIRRWVKWIGTFGHLARMVVFGLVGVFLIKAAVDFDPRKAVGIDGALAKLANSPSGPYLLGVVAAGLIAFAAYSLSDARYRRI